MANIRIKFHDNTNKVYASVHEAARMGIDDTMKDCVKDTKAELPVASGRLYDSKEYRPATDTDDGLVGKWGTFDPKIDYAAYIETNDWRHYVIITAPMPDEFTKYNLGKRYQQVMAAEKHYPDFVNKMKANYS